MPSEERPDAAGTGSCLGGPERRVDIVEKEKRLRKPIVAMLRLFRFLASCRIEQWERKKNVDEVAIR